MISSKEMKLYKRFNETLNVSNAPKLKRKKDGTLDMRYGENLKLFGEEYKRYLLLENRKYNNICNKETFDYRQELLDEEWYKKKIETNCREK
tara:strand:- start:733 stop:1008 length:276 start_codon:yes stop_codon:yes gene_type:complete